MADILKGKTFAIIGYGNQGRAQALNLKDSGYDVIVGTRKDDTYERALSDGLKVGSVKEASEKGDIIFMLIPDEIQPAVYEKDVAPGLEEGNLLNFASGYNITFDFITPPANVDVIMVAPRMIGSAVRELYEAGKGFPSFIGVHQDHTGKAGDAAMAIAEAIGTRREYAIESSFEEEMLIDLLAEQGLWAGINRLFLFYFECLVEAGCNPEAVATDLFLSGEMREMADKMTTMGWFDQLSLHSLTSQYGQTSRGPRIAPDAIKKEMNKVLEEISSGVFAREWSLEQSMGHTVFKRLIKKLYDHPMRKVDVELRTRWGRI